MPSDNGLQADRKPDESGMRVQQAIARLARVGFIGAAVLFAAILGRSVWHAGVYSGDAFAILLAFVVPAAGIVGSVWLARMPPAPRATALLLCASVSIPLYGAETFMVVQEARPPSLSLAMEFAVRRGDPVEDMTPLEYLRAEWRKGRQILPTLRISNVPFFHESTGPMFIRGSAAKQLMLGGSESGSYLVYRSDEFGFKNPPKIWGSGRVFLVAVGDSFIHGASVPMDQDIVGFIRQRHPFSLNLGRSGIGPLYYYQNIVEYASVLKPRYLLFGWFEGNDVTDMKEEAATPLLAKFIGRKKPFGLHALQDAIDRHLTGQLPRLDSYDFRTTLETARQFTMLYRVRKLLGLGAAGSRHANLKDRWSMIANDAGKAAYPTLQGRLLETILRDAQEIAAGWGGQVVFVYLPAWERICARMPGMAEYCPKLRHDFRRREVLQVVARLGLPLVDMVEEFGRAEKPERLFYFPGSHYSPAGNALVGRATLDLIASIEAGKR